MSFTERFSTRADAYALSRPSYPDAALDAVFGGTSDAAALAVADLGAGTGISARLLADRGAGVFAIEPNRAMRDNARAHPRVTWVDGTAENTTLRSRAIDVVTAFQAWHWFDHAAATAEIRRILKPGGSFVVVYNERDERDPFTAAYGDVVRRYATDATEQRRAAALDRALHIEPARTTRTEFPNRQTLDAAGTHGRADSSSYLPQTGPAAAAMHADIDALLARFAASGTVEMHLITIVARVELSLE